MGKRILVAMLITLAGLYGQSFTGTLSGVVTDATKAAIPGTNVVLKSLTTGEERTAVSNELGRFTFSQLQPSTYSLTATRAGFQEYVRSGIALTTNQSLDLPVEMSVGQLGQRIEVASSAPVLDTQTANRSVSLDQQTLQELPLNARNPMGVAFSMAGMTAIKGGPAGTNDQGQSRFAMNGGRNTSVAVLVDGISVISGDWGGAVAMPGVDAVQEVQVIRNTYEAQFGRTGGGVVNVTTKSGSDKFHGAAYEYLRNDNLDANGFFNNKFARKQPEFKRNQYGALISGPIWKPKHLHGFFGYEAVRSGSPGSRTTTVPTELQRKGDFSRTFNGDGTLSTIYDPLTTKLDPARPGKYIRTPFPGNGIPSSRLDPVGLNVVKLYPAATDPGLPVTEANNFFKTTTGITDNNRYDGRVDWARNAMHTLFGRFTISRQNNLMPLLFDELSEPTNYRQPQPRFQVSFGNTFVLSPTLVVNVLLGGGRWNEQQISYAYGFDATTLGFPKATVSQFDVPVVPNFSIGDYNALGRHFHYKGIRNLFNSQVNVTKMLGAHSIKFGWSWELSQLNTVSTYGPNFSFTRFQTGGPDPDSRVAVSGNSIASLLLGFGSGGAFPRNPNPAASDPYNAWYLQDSWRINRRITFNYGFRYEIQGGRTERFDRLARFNYDVINPLSAAAKLNLKGGLEYVTGDQRGQWNTDFNNFAPRAGIAIKLTNNFVARAGYGIFYAKPTSLGPLQGTDGYSVSTPWVYSLDGRTPTDLLSNPFPSGSRAPVGSKDGLLTNVGFGAGGFHQIRPAPYVQQYSLDLQYEFKAGTLLQLSYSGSQGRKLSYGYSMQFNQLPDAALALGDALLQQVPNPFYGLIATGTLAAPTVQRGQLLRPYPQFTGVGMVDMPGASSSYNSATVELTRRFSRGASLIATYQFSKTLDNASENTGGEAGNDNARNFNNLSLERSVSAHNLPHSLSASFIYELPVGRKKAFGSNLNRAVDGVAGGWQISGVFKVDSGFPLRFTAPNNTFSLGGNQVPNVSDLKLANVDHPTIERWFNTEAFSQPAPYTFGNTPRWVSNIRVPHSNLWNLAASKNFTVTERVTAQFRAEFFNAFNYVRYDRADTTFGSRTFGQVTAADAARNLQFGLRLGF